jgi:hypothetical protein
MRFALPAAAVVLLGLAVCQARADGLLYSLPKDGAWAKFDFEAAVTTKMEGAEKQVRMKGTMRMASVGQVVEDGQPCRWIEVAFEMKIEDGNLPGPKEGMKEIAKVLVPEKYLVKGQSPLEHAVRAWQLRGKGKPRELKDPQNVDNGPIPLLLSGPLKDAKALEKVEVESKLGKLACEGQSGTLELNGSRNTTFKAKVESRLHPDAPFGVVSSRWALEIRDKEGQESMGMDWTLKLSDSGDKAASEMPDSK